MTPLLELENVAKTFAPVEGCANTVLSGIDLEIGASETLAIAGPSGSGKSTLLFLLGTLETPTTGRVLWEGRDLADLSADRLADFRNREIGFIFQEHHLLPQLSAFENVLVPTLASKAGRDRSLLAQRAEGLLATVGLKDRMAHRPAQLSGGERQRVACVRALINAPRLLLADEPTGSLDRRSADELTDLLLSLNESEGVALVTVTHASKLAHRMQRGFELLDGSLCEAGRETGT